jgi:hypothetical protein
MKNYPKIPRYDHPVVDPMFYESGVFWLTEKMDGSNFKFTLYEDRFADRYDEAVHETGATDGDVVFGSKTVVRGTDATDLSDLDGNFRRVVRHLRKALNRDALRAFQNEYGPLVCFAENMVHHTIDYDYRNNPPPPLLGFDVYAPELDPREQPPPDPYEEHFEGFLPAEVVFGEANGKQMDSHDSPSYATDGRENDAPDITDGLFTAIGLDPTPIVERNLPAEGFDPEQYDIPQSAWTDDIAEGVVVRKDADYRRVKLVTDAFDELNRRRWGQREEQAADGTEQFVARYCTNARIRKTIHKMINDEGYEFSRGIIEDLYPRVVDDIWAEEWREIKHLDIEFNPSEVRPLVAKRCAEVVTMMETNAQLNDAPAETLWRETN